LLLLDGLCYWSVSVYLERSNQPAANNHGTAANACTKKHLLIITTQQPMHLLRNIADLRQCRTCRHIHNCMHGSETQMMVNSTIADGPSGPNELQAAIDLLVCFCAMTAVSALQLCLQRMHTCLHCQLLLSYAVSHQERCSTSPSPPPPRASTASCHHAVLSRQHVCLSVCPSVCLSVRPAS
jgi:hypothetical protein